MKVPGRLFRRAAIVLMLAAISILFAAWLIQSRLSGFLQDYARKELGWNLKIGSAEIQFYPLVLRLESIEISTESREPFAKIHSASVSVPYSSFWGKEFVVHQIRIDSPQIDVGSLPSRSASSGPSEAGRRFRVEDFLISSARIQIGAHQIERIKVRGQADADGLQLTTLEAQFRTFHLNVRGKAANWKNPICDLQYDVRGDLSGIADLLPDSARMSGNIITAGTISGTLPELVIEGQTEESSLSLNGSASFLASGKYRYAPGSKQDPIHFEAVWKQLLPEVLRTVWNDVPPLSSVSSGTIQYSGSSEIWSGEAALIAHLQAQPSGPLPAAGSIHVSLHDRNIHFTEVKLSLPASSFTATGTWNPDRLDARIDLRSSNLKELSSVHPDLARVPGTYTLTASATGTADDLAIQGELAGTSGSSTLTATGTTRTGSKSVFVEFGGKGDAADFPILKPALAQGEFTFSGSVSGNWNRPVMHLSLAAADLVSGDTRVSQFTMEIDSQGSTLNFKAGIPDFHVAANGSYSLNSGKYEIQGECLGAPAEKLLDAFTDAAAPLTGAVNAEFSANGYLKKWKDSTVILRLQPSEFQWKNARASISSAEIQMDQGIARILIEAKAENAEMSVRGSAALQESGPVDLDIAGNLSATLIEKITAEWKSSGQVDLKAHIGGTRKNPDFQGQILGQNLDLTYLPKNLQFQIAQATGTLSGTTIQTEGQGTFAGSRFIWNGTLPLTRSNGSLHLEAADLALDRLMPNSKISGNLNLIADLQGQGFPLNELKNGEKLNLPFHEWNGEISVSPSDLKLGPNSVSVDAPLHLSLREKVIHLSPVGLSSNDLLDVQAEGEFNLESGAIDSRIKVDAGLDLLTYWRADIQSSGPLTADLTLKGTIVRPEYSGTVRLSHASLRVPDFPLFFEELDLLARVDNQSWRIESLNARSGGGQITGGGELVLGMEGSHLWIQGKNVAANYPEGLRSQSDFDLKLTRSGAALLLSGDVNVLRSAYDTELTLRNPILRKLLSSSHQFGEEKLLKNRIRLALNIKTIQDLRLKNSIAIVRTGGNLKLEGSVYRPKLSGRLTVRSGSRIFLIGNEYAIEKANIDFYGSELLEPNFDVVLSSLLRDGSTDTFYEVFVPFGGTPSSIVFKNVRANPSLSEDQVFSLLTQGSIESAQPGAQGTVFQRQLLAFFAGQALSAPGTAVARTIGLSRIQVQQEALNSVNDPKTRLVLGKDIGAGFTLIYSFVLNEPQDQTWIASYRYGRNVVARFVDQDDGTYTTSINHRVTFGKGNAQYSGADDARKKERGLKISSIELQNNAPLAAEQVQSTLRVSPGEYYDYWKFQERADSLKKQLQQAGYLAPSVEVAEEQEKNTVMLKIQVQTGEKAEMLFRGYQVEGKLLEQYMSWWRQAISPIVVQQMIQENLLRQLRQKGHHQASVTFRTEKPGVGSAYYFDVTPGLKFAYVELQFKGTNQYDSQALQTDLRNLYSSSEELFTDSIHKFSVIENRIKSLYAAHGFLKTAILTDPAEFQKDSGKVLKKIQIDEGPLSRIATVTINDGQEFPDSLQRSLLLRDGETFVANALVEDELKIQGYYESEGYENASADYNIQFQQNSSDLTLHWSLITGKVTRIRSVRILGNETTRSDLILSQTNLKPGEVLSDHRRSLVRKRLSDLGVFQQVSVETEETDDDGEYDVVVRVVENRRYELQYGARYNTDDHLGVEFRLSDSNLFGRAQNLSLYARSSLDLPLFRLDYTLPVTGSFWDRTRFSLFRDERDDDVEQNVSDDIPPLPFTEKQVEFQFQQERRMVDQYRLIYGFDYGTNRVTTRDLDLQQQITIKGLVARFHATFLSDRRDDPLNAQKGYFFSVDGEFAPEILGSDISYLKNYSQFFYYRKVGKLVYAAGVRTGFLNIRNSFLTISEKFRSGGSNTLRGFELNTVVPGDDFFDIFFGGDSVIILNQEMRFPIYKWFSGAVFYDGGNVYKTVQDFDPSDLRNSLGFGIRAGTGGFLLRFDLGFNLDPQEAEPHRVFHFNLGQAF